jgi:hypothetical protein
VPLSPALRTGGDAGVPVVLADPRDAAGAILAVADAIDRAGRGLSGRRLPVARVSGPDGVVERRGATESTRHPRDVTAFRLRLRRCSLNAPEGRQVASLS